MAGDKKSLISDLVRKYKLDLRLTPNQDILLCNISNKDKSVIEKQLTKIGYGQLDNINEWKNIVELIPES